MARVRELGQTLELTTQVPAPGPGAGASHHCSGLADTVRRWLPGATAGRYTEVIVDPEQLKVLVRAPAGRWREADRLSYGTAEQVYLMLRLALAEHLVLPGTSCPLLLDDVTVHADAERTVALLELLRRVAERGRSADHPVHPAGPGAAVGRLARARRGIGCTSCRRSPSPERSRAPVRRTGPGRRML